MLSSEELNKRFGKHRAALEGPNPLEQYHGELREDFVAFAVKLDTLPDGRNKSLALTALEEASMWSHKALANDYKEN